MDFISYQETNILLKATYLKFFAKGYSESFHIYIYIYTYIYVLL